MSSKTESNAPGHIEQRLYFLDWLRILAFAILVLYHVGMYYVSWDFHVKSPHASPDLVPWMKLSDPWRMSLLFMISGSATACLLKNGMSRAFVRQRSMRLLLPLACGVLIVVPPQSYFEVVQKFEYTGNFAQFLRLYYAAHQGFCNTDGCLMLPTWNHLWFLPYLWAYTMLVCAVLWLWPTGLRQISRFVDSTFRGWGIVLVPMSWLFFLRVTLLASYPSTHAFWGDWFNHALYLTMFLLGATFVTLHPWARLARLRWPNLGLAMTFWAILTFTQPSKPSAHAITAIYQWSALVAAFGFAKTHLDKDSWLRSHLSEVIFPVYLLHQTIIIVMSQLLLPLRLPLAQEGTLLVLTTYGLSYAGYLLIKRTPVLQPWFGLKTARHKA